MRIVWARRISQGLFLVMFLWLCVAMTVGDAAWQLRGWPVNLFLRLDPLVALGTILTTGTLYWMLLPSIAVVVLTLLVGRFFCGWVCPFGTMHHTLGWVGRRNKKTKDKIRLNRYRRGQRVKYYLLAGLLGMALGGVVTGLLSGTGGLGAYAAPLAIASLVVLILLVFRAVLTWRGALLGMLIVAVAAAGLAAAPGGSDLFVGSLQTGLLDPIPLVHRSVNLALLPLADRPAEAVNPVPRYYTLTWLIGGVFLAALALNFLIPRFYCRFVCPLGALFGLLDGWALWRIGRTPTGCTQCHRCETDCEGGCNPSAMVHIPECVLCFNCTDRCPQDAIAYSTARSVVGEYDRPDLGRRGVLAAVGAGVVAAPLARLAGAMGPNWSPTVIRPPGALNEPRFLERCIKCGQCMRVCPTNVIQPAGAQAGLEGLLTPILNNRIGTSGCQLNCVACGNTCPTGAIRAITLDEKHGTGEFAGDGPIKLGTAFVDRGRCLPWAMNRPCIVCQENCPVSPKAIYVREIYETVRQGRRSVRVVQGVRIELDGGSLKPGAFATGDYYLLYTGRRYRIAANDTASVSISPGDAWQTEPAPGSEVAIQVRLQQPVVDAELCIGCGTCEHECPVSGKRAIRITAEGETRSDERTFLM